MVKVMLLWTVTAITQVPTRIVLKVLRDSRVLRRDRTLGEGQMLIGEKEGHGERKLHPFLFHPFCFHFVISP
jgi:hypothetical protein